MVDEAKIEEVIKKITPLTEATFYILVALKEPLHGYGVMQKVGEISKNRVPIRAGDLVWRPVEFAGFGTDRNGRRDWS